MMLTCDDLDAARNLAKEALTDVNFHQVVKDFRGLTGLSLRESVDHITALAGQKGVKIPNIVSTM